MEKRTIHKSSYFYGNKISQYGLENGYLDYSTLAKTFDAVLVNDITKLFYSTIGGEYIEPEQVNGIIDNSEAIEAKREQIEALEYTRDNSEDDKQIAYIDEQIKIIEDQINDLEYEQDAPREIYQYFIISERGAEILQEFTNDPVFYIDFLDCYVWGVCHWGTSWSYVLTDVKLILTEDDEQ